MFRSVLLLAKVTIGLDGLDTRLQQYYDPQGCWACTPTPAKCVKHSPPYGHGFCSWRCRYLDHRSTRAHSSSHNRQQPQNAGHQCTSRHCPVPSWSASHGSDTTRASPRCYTQSVPRCTHAVKSEASIRTSFFQTTSWRRQR